MKITCKRCGREWNYKGTIPHDLDIPFWATCGICRYQSKIVLTAEQKQNITALREIYAKERNERV